MSVDSNKTRLVCTIGPASDSPAMLAAMLAAGMDVARLNFSHGDFESHGRVIRDLRRVAGKAGRRLAIMADLPGPKIRIGRFADDAVQLKEGGDFRLVASDMPGDRDRVSVTFLPLPSVVKPGDLLFLSDGLIQLEVTATDSEGVDCRVVVGGELRSGKGLNLPGIDLGIPTFTDRDRECLRFALEQGVDAVSQSFVECAADIVAVREAAAETGHEPFVIAKIERAAALDELDGILGEADGIMIARGDLGVEVPIEKIALIQKDIMRRANLAGKPVITATQMLESMTHTRLPTRAEATDVANAVLDGTDCVMLSGESAVGKYPLEAVRMLARMTAEIEPARNARGIREALSSSDNRAARYDDLMALSVESTFARATPAAVIVWTERGRTARSLARLRLPVWILAASPRENTCQALQFTYGVRAVHRKSYPPDMSVFLEELVSEHGISGEMVVMAEGALPRHPHSSRIAVVNLQTSS